MSNDLKHVGILGMHWGRRKSGKSGPDKSSADHVQAKGLKGKKLTDMSNDELKTLTTRLQLEKSYKDLTKGDIDPGKKFLADVLSGFMKQQSINLLNMSVTNAGKLIRDIMEAKSK